MRASPTPAVVFVLALLAGCSSTDAADATPPPEPRESTAAGASAWSGTQSVATHAGSYLVRWRAAPETIVEGRTFAVDAWVFDAAAPGAPLADVELDVDAGMPQHGHGMAALARVERRGAGWRAEGLRFHMVGAWELVFDVTRGARTERAQAWVTLE